MRTLQKMMFLLLGLVMIAGQVLANSAIDANVPDNPVTPIRSERTLDDQCAIDFTGFTYGSYSGSMTWPGGSGQYQMSGYILTNTCTPGVPLYTYCIDLNHLMNFDPYCAEINDAVVAPPYPEQFPAMAYVMSWYPVSNSQEDRILQLALWKLSNDTRDNSPTYGVPYYQLNAGRGYPNLADPPVYPFVNTVYNSDPLNNDPANDLIRFALGATDSQPKNVVMEGDQLLASYGTPVVLNGVVEVPVLITLQRGPRAIAAGNTSLSGVKLGVSVNQGALSESQVFTDGLGQATLTITRPFGAPDTASLQICSQGIWPRTVVACPGGGSQLLVVQAQTAGSLITVCTGLLIPPDAFLSVELTSFSAVAESDRIVLTWQTASELNSAFWEIQRSVSGANRFSRLAVQECQNSATGATYRLEDQMTVLGVMYDYRLVDVDLNGVRTVHDAIQTAGLSESSSQVINSFKLEGNFPNPFNPETSIRFSLPADGEASLAVFDLNGREVARLVNGPLAAGEHSVTFSAGNLPSGAYFCRLSFGGMTSTRKMVLMK